MNTKRIAIIAAMEKEKQAIEELLVNPTTTSILNRDFIIGQYQENEIIFVLAGIGKVNAALTTTLLIEHFQPDLIINSGIAGGYKRTLKTLDIVIATKLSYSDVDAALEEFEQYGQIPGMPFEYSSAYEIAQTILEPLNRTDIFYGKILSGDQFVINYRKQEELVNRYFPNDDIMAFDMEACAIAQVAYIFNTPIISIKSISDIIGETSVNDYNDFSYKASAKVKKIVELIINNLK